MSTEVTQLTDDNFDQAIKTNQPALIDFGADWCAPCKRIEPFVDEIAKEYAGRIKIFKVNVDNAQNTAAKYQVMSIPTLLFVKGGQVADRIIGVVPKSAIDEKLKQIL